MVLKEDVFILSNLELAFQRLKSAPQHLHKQLYWTALKDIEPFRKEYFDLLIEKYSKLKQVESLNTTRAYLPKKGGFVRPITYIGFEALIIYQAIANKLTEHLYKDLNKNYDKITFGNHFNENFSSPFVFSNWKKRWKKYQCFSKSLIEERGFNYVVDFDIASFYDSIDHKLLKEVFRSHLHESLIDILLSILQLSHSDFKHIKPDSGSGIPQGPLASTVLAEIFLHFYIDEYFVKQVQRNEIAYIRYADDIRVFSRQKEIAKKFITILDLLCRNSGLIPQSSKVGVKFYETSKDLIDEDVKKFSQIQNHYKEYGNLKSKESDKAIKLIKEMLKSGEIDKTKFNFYIYKLDKDDDLKDLILANIVDRYEFCEPMLSYVKKHYSIYPAIIYKLIDIFVHNDNFFLDYPLYSLFEKFYDHIGFDSSIFFKLLNRKETAKWLSNIALVKWALYWNQKEVLDSLNIEDFENILLKREILCAQYELSKDIAVKQQREKKMLESEQPDLLFKSISLIHTRMLFGKYFDNSLLTDCNHPLIKKIITGDKYNPIADAFRKQDKITHDSDILFSKDIFFEENEFDRLSVLCNFSLNYYKDKDYKLFIDSADQFNHILIERLFCLKKGNRPQENYGALLKNKSFVSDEMIGVCETFLNIHLLRNNELHPKDIKTGKFHHISNAFHQKTAVLDEVFQNWIEAIEEILAWYSRNTFQ